MTLSVDARGLHTSGIGRYMREVLAVLLADGRFAEVTLLGDPHDLGSFVDECGTSATVRIVPYAASWFSRGTQTAWLALQRGPAPPCADVWFFPFPDVPLLRHPARSVATIHDLIVLNAPRTMYSWKGRLAARITLHGAARRATRLIAVSHATHADLVARMPWAAGRVDVVHEGVSRLFSPLAPGELAAHPQVAARRPYLLAVGNRSAHKNWRLAVDALALAAPGTPGLTLVAAGGRPDAEWERTLAHAARRGVRDAIVDLGRVSDAELRVLYGAAEAFLMPSLYEGFGLPVLEAMACGTPVIAANRASLPEVAGDAGFLVEPDDPAAVATIVRRLATDPALRADRRRRGLDHAARFDWSAAGCRTADILHATALDHAP